MNKFLFFFELLVNMCSFFLFNSPLSVLTPIHIHRPGNEVLGTRDGRKYVEVTLHKAH